VDLASLKIDRVLADDDTAIWRNPDGTTQEIPMMECYQLSNYTIVERRFVYGDVAGLVST
jgi:hypothetical protein